MHPIYAFAPLERSGANRVPMQLPYLVPYAGSFVYSLLEPLLDIAKP